MSYDVAGALEFYKREFSEICEANDIVIIDIASRERILLERPFSAIVEDRAFQISFGNVESIGCFIKRASAANARDILHIIVSHNNLYIEECRFLLEKWMVDKVSKCEMEALLDTFSQ